MGFNSKEDPVGSENPVNQQSVTARLLAPSYYLTRNDIAVALGVSCDSVRRNEKKWGLIDCRRDLNSRVVQYVLPEAAEIVERLKSSRATTTTTTTGRQE